MTKVLVVDDSRFMRKLAKSIIEQNNIECEAAANSKEALSLAERESFDLIILDVWLGENITGFDLCRTLKDSKKPSKILIMSASDENEHKIADRESGADAYLQKPIMPNVFMDKISDMLGLTVKESSCYASVY